MPEISMTAAQEAARRFVLDEAEFAQLTTIDARGYPVTRTMAAFLQEDWSVATVQRRLHRRLDQWRRNPRTEVVWTGTPRPGATNERPHVFDLNLLPPRLVAVRGDAQFMDRNGPSASTAPQSPPSGLQGTTEHPLGGRGGRAACRRPHPTGPGAPRGLRRGGAVLPVQTRAKPRRRAVMFKTILGYDIEDGVTEEEYERWLFDVHAPDLLANPHLDRIIFNKVEGRVTSASGGTADIPQGQSFYRIAEMHFADEAAFRAYREWFADHPIPLERGPAGRTRQVLRHRYTHG